MKIAFPTQEDRGGDSPIWVIGVRDEAHLWRAYRGRRVYTLNDRFRVQS